MMMLEVLNLQLSVYCWELFDLVQRCAVDGGGR
jgi:hypothetical protein